MGEVISTFYSYDAYGNVTSTSVTGGSGDELLRSTTSADYDSYGRLETETDARGKTTTYSRNLATELLDYVQLANQARTAYVYDSENRLTGVYNDKDRDGVKDTGEEYVNYTYNEKNQLTAIATDSTTYTLMYGSFGESSCVKAGNYTLASYQYNGSNGKLTETEYGNGFTVTNVYDNLDRLVEVKYNNSTAYTVSYNQSGAVSSVADALCGITTEYEYDSLGRLIRACQYNSVSGASILQTQNQYDAYGRAKSSVYGLNGITQSYTLSYKAYSSLISNLTVSVGNVFVYKEYIYDNLERIVMVNTHTDAKTFAESYTYVTNGINTTSLVATHTVGGVVYAYTYDDVGNILTISENNVLRYSYTYDKLGQLTSANYYSDAYYTSDYYDIYEYAYDKAGNITSVGHHYGEGIAYSDFNTYTYGNETWGDLLTNYNVTAIICGTAKGEQAHFSIRSKQYAKEPKSSPFGALSALCFYDFLDIFLDTRYILYIRCVAF